MGQGRAWFSPHFHAAWNQPFLFPLALWPTIPPRHKNNCPLSKLLSVTPAGQRPLLIQLTCSAALGQWHHLDLPPQAQLYRTPQVPRSCLGTSALPPAHCGYLSPTCPDPGGLFHAPPTDHILLSWGPHNCLLASPVGEEGPPWRPSSFPQATAGVPESTGLDWSRYRAL